MRFDGVGQMGLEGFTSGLKPAAPSHDQPESGLLQAVVTHLSAHRKVFAVHPTVQVCSSALPAPPPPRPRSHLLRADLPGAAPAAVCALLALLPPAPGVCGVQQGRAGS